MSKQKYKASSNKSTSLYLSSASKPTFQDIEGNQLSFLLLKNKELQERTLRMAQYIIALEKEKNELLKLNTRYIQTLNQQFKNRNEQFSDQIKISRKNSPNLCKHCSKNVLEEFEKDYRNLIKHCLTLEAEIGSKNQDVQKLQCIKKQLMEAKHDNVKEIIEELVEITQKLVQTKKQMNQLQFQNQSLRKEVDKNKKYSSQSKNEFEKKLAENQNFKSLINTVQNQFLDKENKFKQKIYELEVTIQKLQKEAKNSQQIARNCRKQSQELRIKHIQMALKVEEQYSPLEQNKRTTSSTRKL